MHHWSNHINLLFLYFPLFFIILFSPCLFSMIIVIYFHLHKIQFSTVFMCRVCGFEVCSVISWSISYIHAVLDQLLAMILAGIMFVFSELDLKLCHLLPGSSYLCLNMVQPVICQLHAKLKMRAYMLDFCSSIFYLSLLSSLQKTSSLALV